MIASSQREGEQVLLEEGRLVTRRAPSPDTAWGCLRRGCWGSRNYLNSEVETQAAVDPSNPSQLGSAWQYNRWWSGQAVAVGPESCSGSVSYREHGEHV